MQSNENKDLEMLAEAACRGREESEIQEMVGKEGGEKECLDGRVKVEKRPVSFLRDVDWEGLVVRGKQKGNRESITERCSDSLS